MQTFDVIAYREYTAWDKVYLRVEANSAEEAMTKVKADPDSAEEMDYKGGDVIDSRWVDKDKWTIS